jgi:KipI family sensor histidine kinase inhibitor
MRPILRQISPFLLELFWDETPSDELLQRLMSCELAIKKHFGIEVQEIRMGYQTLSCLLQGRIRSDTLKTWKIFLLSEIELIPLPNKIWRIPVCYDPAMGKDIIGFCNLKNITLEELIELHTRPLYRIHFFGFLPGFMYLNGLDPLLYLPRKSVPDQKIESGSVAIGGSQTGIYPTQSPGGWHVVGKTPLSLFDQNLSPPVFAKPGEQIRFYSICMEEFDQKAKETKLLESHD